MSVVLLLIVLALGWGGATGNLSLPNLLLGAVVGALGLFVVRRYVSGPGGWGRTGRVLALAFLFLRELILSALRVAALVLRPNLRAELKPAIVAFPLRVTRDAEIALLANLITLTPGTLSIDVSEDRQFLYIHAIQMRDKEKFIAEIRDGFETRVMEAFR